MQELTVTEMQLVNGAGGGVRVGSGGASDVGSSAPTLSGGIRVGSGGANADAIASPILF